MTSAVVSDRFPYLPIRILIRQRAYEFDALIDTGFDGSVVIPRALIPGEVRPDLDTRWFLADGTEVWAPAYRGAIGVGSLPPLPVVIAAIGSDVMVGVTVLRHYGVFLDHGQRVIVEP